MMPNQIDADNPSPPSRFYELDSLRGLAATIVVLDHFDYLLPPSLHEAIEHTPLKVLVNGHGAFVLFFVLSGFVLTLPLHPSRSAPLPRLPP